MKNGLSSNRIGDYIDKEIGFEMDEPEVILIYEWPFKFKRCMNSLIKIRR